MLEPEDDRDCPPAECTYTCKCGRCLKAYADVSGRQSRPRFSPPTSNYPPKLTSELGRRKEVHRAACVRLERIKQSKADILEQERKATLEVNKTRLDYEELLNSASDAVRSLRNTKLPDLSDVGKMVQIFGNTFKVKDKIRALGGKWDPLSRTWSVPKAKEAEAKQIVASVSRYSPSSYIERFDEEDDEYRDIDEEEHYRSIYGDAAADGWGFE